VKFIARAKSEEGGGTEGKEKKKTFPTKGVYKRNTIVRICVAGGEGDINN